MIPMFQLLTTKPPIGGADGEAADPDGVAGFLAVLGALDHSKPDRHARTGTDRAPDSMDQPLAGMAALQTAIPLQPVLAKGQGNSTPDEGTPAEITVDAKKPSLELATQKTDTPAFSSDDAPPPLTAMIATDSKASPKPVDALAQIAGSDEGTASIALSASPAPFAVTPIVAKAPDPASDPAAAARPEAGFGQPAKTAAKPAKASLVEASLQLRLAAPDATAADADAAPTTALPEAIAPGSAASSATIAAPPDDAPRPSGETIVTDAPDPFSTEDLLSVLSIPMQHRLTSGKGVAAVSQHRQSVDLAQVPQTVAQLVLRGDQQTELNLHPAELGRLRFAIQHQGDKLTVILSAEQAGTLSLLRRNADELIAELAASGFKDASLSFGQWNEGGQGSFAQGGNGQSHAPEQDLLLVATPRIYPAKTAGLKGQSLDLKL